MVSQTKAQQRPPEPQAKQLPRNWPQDVGFLTDNNYSNAVTADQRVGLVRKLDSGTPVSTVTANELKHYQEFVNIEFITQYGHPAHGERGLFAAQHLEPDSFVCLYLGHVHTNTLSDTDTESNYDLSYDRDLGLSIDSARCGNESRFTNDYRGIAERPNAEFRDCLIPVKSEKRADGVRLELRVGIFVLSAGKAGKRQAGIKAGEEILVNYGKSFWKARKVGDVGTPKN